MNKITIWHNPRCRKSREGLAIAEKIAKKKKLDLEIRKYLDDSPNEDELKTVLKMLNFKPLELVRVKEVVWKDNYKGKKLSETDIIKAMARFPKLIERPLVIYRDKAVLGRPVEAISNIF